MSESPWVAFQSHRHDLQNYLQLVKAYLQLGRPEKAMTAVDECAEWLGSLSRLQSRLTSHEQDVFWTAVACPHLRIDIEQFLSHRETESLCASLKWLEQLAVEHNIKYIRTAIALEQSEAGVAASQHPEKEVWQIEVDSWVFEWWEVLCEQDQPKWATGVKLVT